MRRDVIVFSDIRFPSPRANGIQVVKTTHALAARGCSVRLVVRQSDPRSTGEILSEFGVEPTPRLQIDRLNVGHAKNATFLPRMRYLVKAFALARRTARDRSVIVTRDLQL